MSRVLLLETTRGPARAHLYESARPLRRLVLGHGAGGGVQAPDLVAVAAALPALGTSVWLVEQPWRVAGRRVAPMPGILDEAWLQVLGEVPREVPVLVGGRSAGARVACRTAAQVGAGAVVALAFPLHPPGRPDRSRADELDLPGVPTLVVAGRSDPFGGPDEVPPAENRQVVAVAGDHSLRAGLDEVVTAVAAFVDQMLSRTPP